MFMQEFSGIWVPLVTPFAPDGTVDAPALAALVRRLADAGVHGFVVCGTTGEPATLSEAEKAQVLETVLGAGGELPLLMGVSGVVPDEVAAQCEHWGAERIAGFLVPPPSYVRPSQQGIIGFFERVAAAAAPHALFVYDIPYRSGVELSLATLRTLARIPGIRGVKDCGGDTHKTQALIADGELAMFAGEDHLIFTHLCQGGSGAIAASAHLHPERFVALYDALRASRLDEARALHHALAPLIGALFAEPNPGPLKAVLASLGRIGPDLRAPMTPPSAAAAEAARAAHAASGLCCGA
jgi:4-hydroxy-tetrahydrodipicolinate synthase